MSDRERRGERSDHPAAPPTPTPSTSITSFLPNLFGRRISAKASATTATAHADGRKAAASSGVTRESIDEGRLTSPPAGNIPLPSVNTTSVAAAAAAVNSPISPAQAQPFHLDAALALLVPGGTKTTAECVEIVKATSVYLANVLLDHTADSSPDAQPTLAELGLKAEDIRTLYLRAMEFAAPGSDYQLRTAAVRLLAVLVGIVPPRQSILEPNEADLPPSVTPRALYKVITAQTGGQGDARTNQMFVEVAALKALTRDGAVVDGMDGIMGYLLYSLSTLTQDWVTWCSSQNNDDAAPAAPAVETGAATAAEAARNQPFGPIKNATTAETATAIIDLASSIVQNRTPLFSPADITHIVRPMITFVWQGILASTGSQSTPPPSTPSAHSTLGRGSQPAASSNNSPAPARRVESVRRATSLTVGRVEPFPHSNRSSMSKSPVRAAATRSSKWSRPFKALCDIVDMLFESATINDDLFDEIFELLCFAFGQDDAMMGGADTSIVAHELVRTMLSMKSGRRGELALRKALEGKLLVTKTEGRRTPETERKVTRGAVIIARMCIEDKDFVSHTGSLSLTFTGLTPSLVAAQSTHRFPGMARVAEWTQWAPVDAEILSLLDNHLSSLEYGGGAENTNDDAWTEGEATCALLDSIYPLIQTLAPDAARTLLKGDGEPLVANFGGIVARLPRAIGRLHSRLHTSSSPTSETPQVQPSFFHPKYIDLLLEMGPNLDEDTASLVIDYFQRECLCLPFTSGWINNIWRLLDAFAKDNELPVARARVCNLLYQDVYTYVDDLPEHRAQLVEHVIVPYLEGWLPKETDHGLLNDALSVLVSAAVSETMLRDEERRRARALKAEAELEAEDAAVTPPQEITAAAAGGSFNAIRQLLAKLAVEAQCKLSPHVGSSVSISSNNSTPQTAVSSPPAPAPDLPRVGRTASREQSGLRNLMRTLSPGREPTSQAVGMSQLLSPPAEDYFGPVQTAGAPVPHVDCKALHAVQALIAIFTRLAFCTPQPAANGARPVRTPASSRCITIFRDLLALLYPLSEPGQPQRLPSKCPRARLTILQWSMRLRADRKHRILFRDDINRFVEPFARILFRTKKTEEEQRAAMEQEENRRRARAATQAQSTPGVGAGRQDDERGRSARVNPREQAPRSRSRSKAAPPLFRTQSAPETGYNPFWCVPETLTFETPPDNHPSEGLLTYDPNHPSLRVKGSPLVEGVWLPVSEYVRMLNGLLRWEHDWELVSYVLVFLPQQLGNKHFFHGIRATREVKALLRMLCDGILEQDNRWERRFHVPSFIKRTHINSAAYQSISILISYRSVFDRNECDRILQSLVFGLEGNALLARPCLQALTVCVYEMENYVSKHILSILQKVQQILSTPAVAVHILEFIVALGNSQLYRNFTEDQYRLVFSVAIGYISEHNARTDQPVDLEENREAFTLSQHVISLAYHVIYIWFLALKVGQRQTFVPRLVRGLLHAKSTRHPVDERMEVCFDWIARYTYGNADPKPATSFMSEVVMRDTPDDQKRSMSWLLGGAIITIVAHQRTGWATITTTRATGQTSILCKLENIPLLDLGETNADMTSLPAFLMANRERHRDVNATIVEEKEDVGTESPPKAIEAAPGDGDDKEKELIESIVNVKSTGEPTVDTSISGYVWSGATPSQRRKDVSIEPSYLGLQLLSSYPNADLNIPRGRPIPKEPKFDRALRGINNVPVINTLKIAVLYVGPGQTTEQEILSNSDGSPLYLDFLAGLGRVIRLKGQEDIFVGGLDRENDNDGAYAYAWWDDLAQMIFHTPTLMPTRLDNAGRADNTAKKRLVGNDYVKIVYNESGQDFKFDTLRTEFNFVNIVISPYATRDVADAGSLMRTDSSNANAGVPNVDEWGGDSEDFFKVQLQRADGIPEFSPIGEYKLVSRRNLPVLVRQIAQYADSMAVRFQHVKAAPDVANAEYITIWRTRWRAMQRLKDQLPPVPTVDANDPTAREITLRDFTRTFSPPEQQQAA